ncbi:MAG: hypothetical protein JNM84_04705 [Planctomycetes bacterium]|nr:hypothetical protein [Planctomycetota bacterium]
MIPAPFAVALALGALAPVSIAQSGWSTPVLEPTLNTSASDTGPDLSYDGLTLHLASFSSGNWEIYEATRASRTAPFGAPVLVSALSDPSTDSGAFLSADGLQLWFDSLRPGGFGGFDLWVATRPNTAAPWGAPTQDPVLSSTGSDASLSMTADGLEAYFLTTGHGAPNAPNNSIFRATRTSTALPFNAPAVVPEVLTTSSHRDVEISDDGLALIYTVSDPATRRLRVMRATRLSRSLPFDPPQPMVEFDTTGTLSGVFSATTSSDGTEMFLAAGFAVAAGSQEILSSRFTGLAASGIASTSGAMNLTVRDPLGANKVYALALSLGNTGFPFGSRTVPIDLDTTFVYTFGVSIPGVTANFAGFLDAQGEAVATLQNPAPLYIGTVVYACGFVIDPLAELGVQTITNAVAVRLH